MAIEPTARSRGRNAFGGGPASSFGANAFGQGLTALVQTLGKRHTQDQPATPAPAATPTPAGTPAVSPQQQAFNAFYATPLYQVPLKEGYDAINANYAGRGLLQSGAAQKALVDYGEGVAGGALRDYFTLLGNQQGVGVSAASAQAGVGTNYANSLGALTGSYADALTGLNTGFANNASNLTQGYANGLSNAYGNLAAAQGQSAANIGNINSNAAIAHANNTNSMIGGITGAISNAAGYLAYAPYSGGGGAAPPGSYGGNTASYYGTPYA